MAACAVSFLCLICAKPKPPLYSTGTLPVRPKRTEPAILERSNSMAVWQDLVAIVVAYLLGCIATAYYIVRLRLAKTSGSLAAAMPAGATPAGCWAGPGSQSWRSAMR